MGVGDRPPLILRRSFVLLLLVLAARAGAFPLPPPLETGHLLGKGLPAGQPPVPLTDELYALGWSRTNAFASMVRRTLMDGSREVIFRVTDLVEDRPVWELRWPDWGDDEAREAWWSVREAEVEGVFSRFGLVPNNFQLGLFPLILDNEYYVPVLRERRDDAHSAWITGLDAVVFSTGRGLKALWSADGYWRWAALLGFLPSPFENRVAVVLVVQPSGWAGPNQPLRFVVSGLSLKAGFPKP